MTGRKAAVAGRGWLPRPRARVAGGLAVTAAGAVLAVALPAYLAQSWSLWPVYGLLALSFTFVWGHGGLFSFSQAAFFGIGGYAYGVLGVDLFNTTQETVSSLIGGAVVAALAATIIGYFIFYGNVRDVYVAVITLAATLVLLTFASSTAGPNYHIGQALLGGYNGMVGVPPLTVRLPGGDPVFLAPNAFLAVAVVVAGCCALGVGGLLRRPFGRVVAGLRENESRTELLGYDVRRYKLVVFAIGGAIAGLGGGLYAAWGTFINPSVFTLQQAALVPIWVLVGGRRSLVGAFAGVIVVQVISSVLGGSGGTSTPIVLGAALIAVVLFLPDGLVPTLTRVARRLVPRFATRPADTAPAGESTSAGVAPAPAGESAPAGQSTPARPSQALSATGLGKQFGGVTALDGVDLTFPAGSVTCLIGPNGAGKSTFFNLLVGRYRPSSGSVRLGSRDITKARPDQRARLGLGIKLQVPSVYGELTVLENVWLAAYARTRTVATADRVAMATLERLNLRDSAHEPAAVLAHGKHQWLEIGMVLARGPAVVLLDEPTAGMTPGEKERTIELIAQLRETASVIVVEHDMEFVRRLGSPVSVFHEGRVFATGAIEDIRRDERVLDIYLGRRAADAAR